MWLLLLIERRSAKMNKCPKSGMLGKTLNGDSWV
jgi:hypothetical protein